VDDEDADTPDDWRTECDDAVWGEAEWSPPHLEEDD
jgi:hypothetical protein